MFTASAHPDEAISRRQRLGKIVYWCYVSAVLIQGIEALAFIYSPTLLYSSATDPVAQLFVRSAGIGLVAILTTFWNFRHVPIHIAGSDTPVHTAALATKAASTFARFHAMIACMLVYHVRCLGQGIPQQQLAIGLHALWALAMMYVLVRNHQANYGRIIDTSSGGAAVRSVVQLIKGDDPAAVPPHRTVMQFIKGEDQSASSKSVMQLLQGEIQ